MLYLKQMEVGPMANFVYLVGDAETKEVCVVDPAWQMDTILKTAEQENLKIVGALITHSHFDHCNAIEELLIARDVPIYVNVKEIEFLRSFGKAGNLFGDFPEEHLKKTKDNDTMKIGNVEIRFLHTPGHTPGSQCFLVKENLISGDTLFIRGCGRCDLPGGDPQKMYESLTQKLMRLPNETTLFPGHHYSEETTSPLSEEKKKNPYLICDSLKTFLTLIK